MLRTIGWQLFLWYYLKTMSPVFSFDFIISNKEIFTRTQKRGIKDEDEGSIANIYVYIYMRLLDPDEPPPPIPPIPPCCAPTSWRNAIITKIASRAANSILETASQKVSQEVKHQQLSTPTKKTDLYTAPCSRGKLDTKCLLYYVPPIMLSGPCGWEHNIAQT